MNALLSDLLRDRIAELRAEATFATDRRDQAGDIADYDDAVVSFGEWERQRRECEAVAGELERLLRLAGHDLVTRTHVVDFKVEADR